MFPPEFAARMQRELGAEYEEFCKACTLPRNTALRLNPLKTDTPPALSRFGLSPVPWEKCGFYYDPAARPGLSPYHEAGLYYLQEASAMAPVSLLDVQPGMTVLDLCAAPGGKTTQIAAKMQGEGLLICNEVNAKRAAVLSGNVERMGIANALVLNEHPKNLEKRFPAYFDRILVDAPCSGEGMFRKEEAAVADWSVETVRMCAARQREILASAASMLAPGGRLVYSTCTFSREENEEVILDFLAAHGEFAAADCDAPWFEHDLGYRLWPHKLRGDGHFAAVLVKEGSARPIARSFSENKPLELLQFCREVGAECPKGRFLFFGDTLFVTPDGLPELKGLKVLRAGLELGQCRKGRLIPAHAWALWLKTAAQTADFPENSPEILQYLHGQTLPGTQKGWTLVQVDGLSIGWAKGTDGILKNHFPKALRRMG